MDPNLAGNRKARRLKRRLDIYNRDVAGLLYALWSHALAHCADGVLADHTDEDIADICEWEGNGTDLVDSLVESGFLERLAAPNDGLVVVSWSEHTGGALTLRAEKKDRERQRSAKRRAESQETKEKPSPTENDRRSKTVDQERPQKTAPERNGTEQNRTEETQSAPTIENILAGEHDDDPKLLGRKATRVRLIEWHCKLWGGNPNQFKPNAKDITGTLKGLQSDGYKPSEVARAMRGMRKDPWDGRHEHNGWPNLRRHMRKWLELDSGGGGGGDPLAETELH